MLIVSSSYTGILIYVGTCPYMNHNVTMAIWVEFFFLTKTFQKCTQGPINVHFLLINK